MQRSMCLLVVGVMFLSLALLLSGCADIAYWQLETFYKLDCRPEHLTPDGKCVPVKKASPDTQGGADVQTAHP